MGPSNMGTVIMGTIGTVTYYHHFPAMTNDPNPVPKENTYKRAHIMRTIFAISTSQKAGI